jgi:peptidoglycan hydrolase FlgJ
MTSDLHGISRLAAVTGAAEPVTAAPAAAGGFVTTVKRAKDAASFETVVKRAATEKSARASKPAAAAPASGPLATPPTSPSAKAGKAQKSFETFALQTFIGSMLPKENNKMFGTGNAGKMWQSLLAEKLAEQIMASGRLKLLPQQQNGSAAVTAPAAAAPANVSAATNATGTAGPNGAAVVPTGVKRQDAAGGMTPEELQRIVGGLRPGRSGGAR